MKSSAEKKLLYDFALRISRLTGVRRSQIEKMIDVPLQQLVDKILIIRFHEKIERERELLAEARNTLVASKGTIYRIPAKPKAPYYRPIERVLQRASSFVPFDKHLTAKIFTYLLEGIAMEVCNGNIVRIPGFGMYTPYYYTNAKNDSHVQIRFIPARTLRKHVVRCTPIKIAKECNQKAESYRRSHHRSTKPDRESDDVHASMVWLRSQMAHNLRVDEKDYINEA